MSTQASNTVDAKVGDRLRLLRLSRKESRSELAVALGTDEVTVMRFERGAQCVGASMMMKISAHYGVRSGYFFETIAIPAMVDRTVTPTGELTAIKDVSISDAVRKDVSQTSELLKAFIALEDPNDRAQVIALCRRLSESRDG